MADTQKTGENETGPVGKFQIYKNQHLQGFSILGFLKIRQNMTFLRHLSLSFKIEFLGFNRKHTKAAERLS